MCVNVPWENTDTNTTYSVVTKSADGLAPKLPDDATKFLDGKGSWSVPPVVTTTANGYCPKLPNDNTKFLCGDGTWGTPAGTGGGTSSYTLPVAATSTLGGVKSQTAGSNTADSTQVKCPVQVDSDGKMYIILKKSDIESWMPTCNCGDNPSPEYVPVFLTLS